MERSLHRLKHSFLNRLRCPISGGELAIHSFESDVIETDEEELLATKEGILLSEEGRVWFPITNYVPVLLRFRTRFHDQFFQLHEEQFAEFSEYQMPYGIPEKGELSVQQSFTDQWNLVQDDDLSFVRTDEDLVNLNRHVWLNWLNPSQQIDCVLDVGCGIGKETMALREVLNPRDVIGIDLNFALLQAGNRYRDVPNVQFVICSLVHLPFRKESIDLVYCQGVLHHTSSTYAAFKSIASFVRPDGYLFIWVYALEDHLVFRNDALRSKKGLVRHMVSTALFLMESLIRPWLSRSPVVVQDVVIGLLSYVLHPVVRWRVIHRDLWKLDNTRHSLRDLLTPVYAFRHGINEVVEWFEESDFSVVGVQSPSAHRKYFAGKRMHGIGITGQRSHEAKSEARPLG
jgi:ubiquinone/menaquinone biosynthesis C-methylase UbiE/uncharacterized protein YbaR (Trm112 family)